MIKFRAWDKETKTMNGMAEIYRNRNQEMELHPRDEEIILMQSTGLIDKDGQEVFEGDILGVETDEGTVNVNVFWDNTHALYMFESKRYNEKDALGELVGDYACPFKVIGNIYENPKLLEE